MAQAIRKRMVAATAVSTRDSLRAMDDSAVVSAFLGVFSCTPEPKGSPLVVEAAADGNSCHITVDHQQVTSQQLLQIASAGKHRWGLIRMKRDLPYKCVGAVIITLQEAGFSTVRTEELDQR